ncbi:MAG: DUF4197 domain-containing protein [Prolixibacteraceae bacterium]|nr:DUF4197 domain-containing protein [Prolixibacteraceae bacterium]
MINIKKAGFVILLACTLLSCNELMQIASSVMGSQSLSSAEIIAGLKQALTVGTDSTVARVSKAGGYYKDAAIKILLPPEADIITKNLSRIPGGDKLVENVIQSINAAAEDAAKEVAPIFISSITSMTITDGLSILKGNGTAATDYLKKTTSMQLFNLYQPKIKKSIDKKLVGNMSPLESWNKLTSEWNKIANSMVGQIAGFTPVNTQLDAFLTQKALDGLFLKIGEQEQKIRTDPLARVTDLLKRVFGSQQ